MQISDYISLAATALSIIAIVISAAVARRQQLFPFVGDVLEDFHQPQFKALLAYIRDELVDDLPQPTAGPRRALDQQTRDRLRPLTSYFNELGLLVANRAVSATLVSGMMGGSIARSWEVLAPYIYATREMRGDDPNYYAYYEHLAACMKNLGPKRLEKKLRLKRLPPE